MLFWHLSNAWASAAKQFAAKWKEVKHKQVDILPHLYLWPESELCLVEPLQVWQESYSSWRSWCTTS